MSAATARFIDLDRSLDGARVLYRSFFSTQAPKDGWVREFSKDGQYVRISRTQQATDAGLWHRCIQLRVEAILDAAKAPATLREKESC